VCSILSAQSEGRGESGRGHDGSKSSMYGREDLCRMHVPWKRKKRGQRLALEKKLVRLIAGRGGRLMSLRMEGKVCCCRDEEGNKRMRSYRAGRGKGTGFRNKVFSGREEGMCRTGKGKDERSDAVRV